MKLGFHIAHWRRLDLFDLVLRNLRTIEGSIGAEFVIAVAGPDLKEDRRRVEQWRARYVATPNSPLGAKCNRAVQLLQDCDVLCGIGSDDLLCARSVAALLSSLSSGCDMAGLLDLYMYDLAKRDLIYWPGYQGVRAGETVGPGRMVSRRLMEAMGWQPFAEELDQNLDRSMFEKLQPLDFERVALRCKGIDGMLVDVKTRVNINPMPHIRKHAKGCRAVGYPDKLFTKHFGADMVDNLHEVTP